MQIAVPLVAFALSLAPPLARLQDDFQPFVNQFDEDLGKVRLVLLLSPT